MVVGFPGLMAVSDEPANEEMSLTAEPGVLNVISLGCNSPTRRRCRVPLARSSCRQTGSKATQNSSTSQMSTSMLTVMRLLGAEHIFLGSSLPRGVSLIPNWH